MKLGAHLSISGGFSKALERIDKIGGNALQIFSTSPRGWNEANVSNEQLKFFLETKNQLNVEPIFFHASYLINLADNEKTGDMSKKTLIAELNLQPKMQIQGSVVHLGSFKKNKKKLEQASLFELNQEEINMYQILLDNINYVLKKTPKNSCILIENAGMRKIGQTIEEIAYIVKNLNNDRIKVCLDTCHLHAAGYNLTSKKDFEQFFQEFDKKIGLKKLALIHLNDSKDPFGSLKDHHENIGQGNVGMDVFKNLVNHKMTKNIPFILETPGFDNKGPDQGNIDIIKSLVHN